MRACVWAEIMAALFDCLAALTSSLSHWARQSKVMHSITPIKADNGRCDSMGGRDSGTVKQSDRNGLKNVTQRAHSAACGTYYERNMRLINASY